MGLSKEEDGHVCTRQEVAAPGLPSLQVLNPSAQQRQTDKDALTPVPGERVLDLIPTLIQSALASGVHKT